jgi:hypothetical protein
MVITLVLMATQTKWLKCFIEKIVNLNTSSAASISMPCVWTQMVDKPYKNIHKVQI